MAVATSVTIGTSNKVSVDYQSQEVHISCTYQLESADADLLAFVTDKADEIEKAHSAVWKRIRDLRAAQKGDASADGKTDPKKEAAPPRSRRTTVAPTDADATPPPPAKDGNPGPTPEPAEAPAPALRVETTAADEAASAAQQRAILSLATRARMSDDDLSLLLAERFGKVGIEDLTKGEAARLLVEMQKNGRKLPAAA